MAAQAPVFGVARLSCVGTAQGIPVVNVFHVRNGGESPTQWTFGAFATMVTGFKNAFKTHLLPLVANSYSGDTVLGIDLSQPTASQTQVALDGSGSGSQANTVNSACTCLTWKIDRRYRGGHPRTYLGPLATTNIESPTSLTAGHISNAIAAGNNFIAAIGAITGQTAPQQLVAVHRFQDGVKLEVPLVSQILRTAVDARIDSQRRRMGPDR